MPHILFTLTSGGRLRGAPGSFLGKGFHAYTDAMKAAGGRFLVDAKAYEFAEAAGVLRALPLLEAAGFTSMLDERVKEMLREAPAAEKAVAAPRPVIAPKPYLGETSAVPKSARSHARNEQQDWIAAGLIRLVGLELRVLPSRLRDEHRVFGQALAAQLQIGLTPRQWQVALDLCVHYANEVGAPPEESQD